jgi:hypothetical protein
VNAAAGGEPLTLSASISSEQTQALKGIRAEACGHVITLSGRMDPATRRLAERLARTILWAEDVRFEDAA